MKTEVTLDQIKNRIAKRLSEYKVAAGSGEVGTLSITLARRVTRTFKAHWSGFKLFYPDRTVVLYATLGDGRFWSEGYISAHQPSWVLTFRKDPHASRGTGGARPEDEYAPPQHYENAIGQRRRWLDSGVVRQEELVRMEDSDDPLDAVDQFFNYTSLYLLKAIDATWAQMGYQPDASFGWDEQARATADIPIDAAIEEGLKRSDIIWLVPDTDPSKSIPCWFLYTKAGRLFVLSGERQQRIPNDKHVRSVHVITRWKGRDARLTEFDAAVRAITADDEEFEELGEQLIGKRQSVREDSQATIDRWKREAVILELIPRI